MARVGTGAGGHGTPASKHAAQAPAQRPLAQETSRSAQRAPLPGDTGLTVDRFMAGLRQVENGGSYDWSPNRVGARGAYQFMDYAGWAREAGVDPNDHSPAAQDAVARFKIEQYLKAYNGDYSMVAAAWLGGPGGAAKWAAGTADPSDGNMTTSQYVSAVLSAAGAPQQAHVGGGLYGMSAPTPGTGAAPATDGQTAQQKVNAYLSDPNISAQFGYLVGFLNDPTIGPILRQAAQEGWDQQTLFNRISQTPWWQHTDQTARYWQGIRQTDPATWQAAVGTASQKIMRQAEALGLAGSLDPHRIGLMAATALNTGKATRDGGTIDTDWLRGALAGEFHYNPKATYSGEAGSDVSALRAQAHSYLVPVSDQTLQDWTRQMLAGTARQQDFVNYLQQQAKSLFPTLGQQIDSGMTTASALSSYAQLAGRVLNLDPNSVDFMDPKWRSLVDTVDPQTGNRVPLSLADAQRKLMTDPVYGYDRTPQARQNAAALGQSLMQMFGYDGTGSAQLSAG